MRLHDTQTGIQWGTWNYIAKRLPVCILCKRVARVTLFVSLQFNFLLNRYNAVEETSTLALENDQDSAFKLQEEIAKASQELSRIYGSLVRTAIFFSPIFY